MVRAIARIFGFVTALLVMAGVAVIFVNWEFEKPGPLGGDTIVMVPRGAGLSDIALLMGENGVVDDPFLFKLGVRLRGQQANLRAGEYRFPAAVSGQETMRILMAGRSVEYPFTVAEGLTNREIFDLLAAEDKLSGDLPETRPPEGTLFPETYQFTRGDSRQSMLDRMTSNMEATLSELWEGRAEGLPFSTPEEALILASIVEKETGVGDERPLVASVFINRLKRGMRLETDPTVIYAITGGERPLGRPLLRADLSFDSPYNTYLNEGLPPGPIANPGRSAIAAVLNPAESDYLFFVADGSGGHAFAKTLNEHNRNVANWRRIRPR